MCDISIVGQINTISYIHTNQLMLYLELTIVTDLGRLETNELGGQGILKRTSQKSKNPEATLMVGNFTVNAYLIHFLS